MSNSKRRNPETLPIVSETGRMRRRLLGVRLHGYPFRVRAIELPRRHFLQLAAGATALAPRIASAQPTYPTRPITMIVPLAAGGASDATARVLAERMSRSLGQPVIIENVTGADGSIGTARAARSNADGYTIDLGIMSTHVLNGGFYSLSYDVLNDFTPISPLVTVPVVFFARKTIPANNLGELIAWLRANPAKASAGTYSVGGRLLTVLFQKETGTRFTIVPYRGGAPVLQDLVSGQIDLFLVGTPADLPLMRAGNIKALAVTSDMRLAAAPEIPTVAELNLPALSISSWMGLFAPKGTPRDIVTRLNAAVVDTLADHAVRSRLVDLGLEIFPPERQTPEALSAMQKADAEKWWPIIKESGIRAE
jgi:tripartite-type tricarboxylate transporter receptor subunit TctC